MILGENELRNLSINLVAGIAMVLSYKKLLAHLDEMEKKIQMGALAVGVTISYSRLKIKSL